MAHVLLLESNTVLTATYTAALHHTGYTVTAVDTAQAAIHAADMTRPDIVVLELRLAGHNGIEFLHEFRSYPEWQNVPIIVHTALTPTRLALGRDALRRDLGVSNVLYKPLTSLEALLHAIREQLVTV
jgi:DNA-binding response OmpR family regulator